MAKKENIKLALNGWVWTPKTEKEMVEYFNSFTGPGEKSLVWLGAQISANYLSDQINKKFTLIKKD